MFEVRITKIIAGGHGLGRHEGRAVIVPGTAAGETHRVRAVAEKKDFIEARSVERVTDSPFRREPPCPYYGLCGGCALMHLEPATQLTAKRTILQESLRRAGYSDPVEQVEICGSPELRYRTRLRFHVDRKGSRPVLGFRQRQSREVVDIEHCLLGSADLNAAWHGVRRLVAERPAFARHLEQVEFQESSVDPGRIVGRFLVRSIDGLRFLEQRGLSALRDAGRLDGIVASTSRRGPRIRLGSRSVAHSVSGFLLEQSTESFFQANRFLLEELVSAVVPETSVDRAIDLYCGVGLFTLPLSRMAKRVFGIETVPTSIRDARANAKRAELQNVRFRRMDAARYLDRTPLRVDDLIVADPPRGGLALETLEAIGGSPVRSLRYVSCDPPALARDVARLQRYGFRIESLRLLDLFPNTHLFETVARLSR
ncbi:MAG TPA: 23S rRNA (uracil(1939)-C(5))-methyltransferase RlmD [Vicinamibacteria bacterium]|nr:23S rRNA (uracil(1939)-C(5))-methyltransferase RlmD [Vicinamibacteria bacterium]